MVVVPSTLDAVTVHAEGALCTRLAAVPSNNGRLPNQVRIESLPLGLRTGSLRAAVLKGPQGLRVRDIRPVYDVRLPPETDLPAEQRALEEARERLNTVSSELVRVRQEVATLQKLKPSFPPRKKDEPHEPRESALTAILSLAGFLDSELASLNARQLELERQQRDATEEVELRQRRLEEGSSAVRGQRAQLYRAAIITLSEVGPADEAAQLALEYAVYGARWVPGYDLRMPQTLDGGTLRMRASIIQRTGEDWSNVRLALSTANLERRADVPELKALRIGRRQPPPARSGWREPPPGLDELFVGYDTARPLMPPRPEPRLERRAPEPVYAEAPMPQGAVLMEEAAASPSLPKPMRASHAMPSVSAPPPMQVAGAATGSFRAGGPPPPPRAPAPGGAPAAPKKASSSLMKRRVVADEAPMEMMKEAAPEELEDTDGYGYASQDLDTLGGGGGGGPADTPARPTGLEPAVDLLDYGSLELAGVEQPGQRGRLQPQSEDKSRELLMLLGVHVRVDVFTLVALYEQTAASVHHAAPPAWSVPPRQSTPHFDYRFDVETRADVPSDGVWHTVPVFSAPVGLSAEYICVPSMEPRAFRTVKVENRTPHALLAGPVDITLGDEFLMTSPLPTLSPGATQRLGLGVEESIKVSRNTRFDEASGGVFGGSNMLTHHVRVELANRTSQRVTVEVLERVPAVPSASEKDIKVDEAEVRPAWSKRALLPGETPVEGERAWKVTLQPGEAQTLNATWAVRIPSSKMLVGGNRRT
ncbi:mucoidy inhibitor MuiA family protein [Archangium violaceum]|uniref:Aspartate ammonia-lyase n=1 Tax=Archangium violaceum Cb vi76 TaxID=1406225 RepID=A0A084SLQ9_9BACT|nr:mucoidy inhibitor MuiA family protein [Archangium violaceum]KFA89394.1 aspartate ammonia-lyase [Archangium violaceum Cb vi76]